MTFPPRQHDGHGEAEPAWRRFGGRDRRRDYDRSRHRRTDLPGSSTGRPDRVGVVLLVVAWALMVPALVQSLDWSGQPGDSKAPQDRTALLFSVAFVFGVAGLWSLRHRRGRTAFVRERRAVQVGLLLASLGAAAWTLLFLSFLDASL